MFPGIGHLPSLWAACIGRNRIFHHNRDPAVLSSVGAECDNTILDPEELTAYLGRYSQAEDVTTSQAQLGEVE